MRKAPKAIRTSDVARPRTLLLSAVGAAAGVTVALVAEGTPLSTPRPIARPHAKLTCASCHGEATNAPPPAANCKTCHGPTHVSTRAGHKKMAAKGDMTCLTCHKQHAGAQGITFDDGKVVRWGSGAELVVPRQNGTIAKGTTVPLVAPAVCTQCHDATKASDPVSACISAKSNASLCFDEHVRVRETHPTAGKEVCAKQHDAARFVAWDAAADVAATTPWVKAQQREGTPWIPAGGGLAGALVLGTASTLLERRRRRAADAPQTRQPAVPAAVKKLPVINPSTCLGCYACVDACPFDVLAIEKYVAVVVRPEECCGVVLCEQVCPNGSLQVVEGEPILDRPATDQELESKDVPGLFLAGDLTGLPLIKNAIHQGVRVVDRIAATLTRSERRASTDVIVIGAGPAGLSAALRAKEKGLSCVVVEQATVAASIKSFPRDKIVHDPPLDLPVEGELWLEQSTKEELLAQWTRIVRARALDVREGHRVVDITKTSDRFRITAEHEGASVTFEGARVILAIGRRGTPRRLEATIERGAEDRISYALADARSFEGKKVLVVGLGDSAMEAAIAIARQPETTVTISYRGATFARGKAKNIRQLETLVAEKRIKLLLETVPVSVTTTGVVLQGTGPHAGRRTVPADAVIVLIGGVPSWDLLGKAGIKRP